MSGLSPAAILYDSAGTEKGTAGNPVRTNPTGTTAQPVTDNAGSLTVDTPQLPAALVGGRLDENVGAWLGSTAPTVGQKTSANSIPVVLPSDSSPIVVSLANPNAIPLVVGYDKTEVIAGAQAGYWLKAAMYTVPVGYKFSIGQYNTYSDDNRVTARVASIQSLGTWNPNTFGFTAGTAYVAPVFGSFLELEVTSVMGNVDDQVVTITYTNQDGVSGRTATAINGLKLKKQTPVGYKMLFELQAGDLGVRSVQSITADKTNTGGVSVNGGIDLYWQSVGSAGQNYIVVPSAANPVIPAGGSIALDISSNAGATVRRLLKVIGNLT